MNQKSLKMYFYGTLTNGEEVYKSEFGGIYLESELRPVNPKKSLSKMKTTELLAWRSYLAEGDKWRVELFRNKREKIEAEIEKRKLKIDWEK